MTTKLSPQTTMTMMALNQSARLMPEVGEDAEVMAPTVVVAV
jgi:hypothetical protein